MKVFLFIVNWMLLLLIPFPIVFIASLVLMQPSQYYDWVNSAEFGVMYGLYAVLFHVGVLIEGKGFPKFIDYDN